MAGRVSNILNSHDGARTAANQCVRAACILSIMASGAGRAYDEAFDALRGIYLEDSWVLGIEPSRDAVTLRLEAVLTREHALYASPARGAQYCYRRGRLTLASQRHVSLHLSGAPPAVDSSGQADLGSIDTFEPIDWEGYPAWELTGDWGDLVAVQPTVVVKFD